jgi:hypothetical protein
MQAIVLLCDAAQVVAGKLYLLGGGWSVAGPGPVPTAIAVRVEVPPNAVGTSHHFELALVDADGAPVEPVGGSGQIALMGDFVAGPPEQAPPGTPSEICMAFNLGVLPLPTGRMEWRLWVDGETGESWSAAFTVRTEVPATEG